MFWLFFIVEIITKVIKNISNVDEIDFKEFTGNKKELIINIMRHLGNSVNKSL
jgi:hypothetical protein